MAGVSAFRVGGRRRRRGGRRGSQIGASDPGVEQGRADGDDGRQPEREGEHAAAAQGPGRGRVGGRVAQETANGLGTQALGLGGGQALGGGLAVDLRQLTDEDVVLLGRRAAGVIAAHERDGNPDGGDGDHQGEGDPGEIHVALSASSRRASRSRSSCVSGAAVSIAAVRPLAFIATQAPPPSSTSAGPSHSSRVCGSKGGLSNT